ncbi:MAG: PAS domain S-box protein [Candidatus Eisenbacteria bacterium]|nr:PAS domain S-box protein [Candidatus Eisenbacteria bacterium]
MAEGVRARTIHVSRYPPAIALVAIATAVAFALGSLRAPLAAAPWLAAIALSARIGGRGPGLLASCLSVAGFVTFLLANPPPDRSIGLDLLGISLFALASYLVARFVATPAAPSTATSRENEERYRQIAELASDYAFSADVAPDGSLELEWIREEFLSDTGFRAEEIREAGWRRLWHPDDLPRIEQQLRDLSAGKTTTGEARIVTRDGQERWLRYSARKVHSSRGGAARIYGTARDITGRKKVEEALRQSEERYRSLALATSQVIWSTDDQGRMVEPIPGWSRITGQEFEQMRGFGWLDAIDRADRPRVEEAWRRSIELATSHESEFRVHDAGGSLRTIHSRAVPVLRAGGAVREWVGTWADVTDAREAEEATRLLASIVESTDDAVFSKLLDGTILSWNPAAQETYGYEPQEVIGRNVSLLVPPELIPEFHGILEKLSRGERIRQMETVRVRKDGSRIHVSLTISPLLDSDGKPAAASTITRDITARKLGEQERAQLLESEQAARAEAERVSRMKDEFFANLSHELRTPINAIYGWSQLLRSEGLSPEDFRQALEVIERNARVQVELIEDLLDMSRIISGKLRLDVRRVELEPVIRAAVESVKPAADAKEIRIRTDLDPDAGPVAGDPARLQQIVWNLLTNAIKFTPHGGHTDVQLRRAGSHAEIVVSDTGIGIASEFLPSLFERFRQADMSTSRVHGGLGLGLAIVRHLTEMHGGTVTARSAGPNEGATFVVSIPIPSFRSDTPIAPAASGAVVGGREPHRFVEPWPLSTLDGVTVLAVDDDDDALQLLRRLLEEQRARVITAVNAGEALAQLRATRPDVLICDIGMPGEDGYTLIRKVRALPANQGGRVPAVALTAYARMEDRRQAIVSGFQIHVAKPVEPTELIAIVANLAGRSLPKSRRPSAIHPS